MIHPFARFGAAPAAGESLWERAELLQRPAIEFAEFLKSQPSNTAGTELSAAALTTPSQTDSPAAAASNPSGGVPPRARTTDPGPGASQSAAPASTSASPAASEETTTPAHDRSGPPRFADVPDSAKFPAGPYRQAPAEYGGEWWFVDPFTGDEPWLNLAAADSPKALSVSPYAAENLPEDFVEAFGEMPARRAGESGVEFAGRAARWKQDLAFFQRTGLPEGFDENQVELASRVYEQWGMGRPVFYEGRYGWFARFPDSAIPEFEMDAASAVQVSHLAVARYQVRLLRQGIEPPTAHPFVPPHLLPQNS